MTEYFAVIDDDNRRGPFDTMREPVALLKANSKARGHTDEQARHFFLHESSVQQVETVDGKVDCFCLGWLGREETGWETQAAEPLVDSFSYEETSREREDNRAEAHFTVTVRKAAEVNEGGLVDANVP
jgi:hypothetical protein